MPVPADHIVGHKKPIRMQRSVNPAEERLEFENVMERLDRENYPVVMRGLPAVDVESLESEVLGNPFCLGGGLRPLQHFRIDIETLERKVPNAYFAQPFRDVDVGGAVTRPRRSQSTPAQQCPGGRAQPA